MFNRIKAYQEGPESKKAIIELGRSIINQRKQPSPPKLLHVLPIDFTSGWELRRDRIGYFRWHLVLNSLFYLSHHNIFDLDHSIEAVTSPYEKRAETLNHQWLQVLVIKMVSLRQASLQIEFNWSREVSIRQKPAPR